MLESVCTFFEIVELEVLKVQKLDNWTLKPCSVEDSINFRTNHFYTIRKVISNLEL